jgi:hypothetical protein
VTIIGDSVTVVDAPTPLTTPTDTSTWFVAQVFERGPITPTLVTSEAQFTATFGGSVSYSVAPDAVKAAFRAGQPRVYISRVVGPAAAAAKSDVSDSVPTTCLRISAKNPATGATASPGRSSPAAPAGRSWSSSSSTTSRSSARATSSTSTPRWRGRPAAAT